jgi:uncharacterized protein
MAEKSGQARSSFPGWRVAPVVMMIRLYQATLSPFLGGHCRFHPTCSRYAIQAYQEFGMARGTWLTLRRLLRCHPFGGRSGYDPVPPSSK